MEEEDIQDEIDRATEIGLENLEIIKLAASWCRHIDIEKGPMGTGLLEQMTGLPITGGSLRCEFAEPATAFGMALKHTAVDFYEENCIGCPHHAPTGRTPNLGTWADAVIAQRQEEQRKAADERTEENVRRATRARQRRLALGMPDPGVQTILDLVDRVDSENGDQQAEGLLLKTAELSPQDFPDALLDHLAVEGIAIKRAALLEVVFGIFERSGRPDLDQVLRLSFEAIKFGMASRSAGRIIAAHATGVPGETSVRRSIIHLAAGSLDHLRGAWTGGEPDVLVRWFDVDHEGALGELASLLRDDEPWMRAMAARAARALVQSRPVAGARLLPALLDSVVLPDRSRYLGDPYAAAAAAAAVADILLADPTTDEAIAARMRGADQREAKALWTCYSRATSPRSRIPAPDVVLDVIEKRAASILRDDFPLGLHQAVAETLSHMTDHTDGSVGLSFPELAALIRIWNAKVRSFESRLPPAQAPIDFLERESERLAVSGVARDLEEALKGRAKRDIDAYIDAIAPLWDAEGDDAPDEEDRASLLEGMSELHTEAAMSRAQPLLVRVLSTGGPSERAAALKSLSYRRREPKIPEPVQRLIVSNLLTHSRLVVVLYAMRALPGVEATQSERDALIPFLVNFADAYKREPLRSDDAEQALSLATRMAEGHDYETRVKQLSLEIIDGMASSDAADALRRLGRLKTEPRWAASVIRALEPDDRGGNWYGVHEGRKSDLIRLLSSAPSSALEQQWEALESAAMADLDLGGSHTWAIADIMGRHGQHERAVRITQAIVDGTPETKERRHRRRTALLVTYVHRIGAAAQDHIEMRRLIAEALVVADEEADDDA